MAASLVIAGSATSHAAVPSISLIDNVPPPLAHTSQMDAVGTPVTAAAPAATTSMNVTQIIQQQSKQQRALSGKPHQLV